MHVHFVSLSVAERACVLRVQAHLLVECASALKLVLIIGGTD